MLNFKNKIMIERPLAENLALLKALLEQGQVTLRDGRRTRLDPA